MRGLRGQASHSASGTSESLMDQDVLRTPAPCQHSNVPTVEPVSVCAPGSLLTVERDWEPAASFCARVQAVAAPTIRLYTIVAH